MNITLIKNVENQHHTKHINVQYYYIRELVNERELTVKWILDLEMLVNGIIKGLSTETF